MGLVKAVVGAASSTFNDGFKDYFYCEALPSDVLMSKGHKRNRQNLLSEDNNIITNGSAIAVADGQAMMIVDQGAIVEFCAEPGAICVPAEKRYTVDIITKTDVAEHQVFRMNACPVAGGNAERKVFQGHGGICAVRRKP